MLFKESIRQLKSHYALLDRAGECQLYGVELHAGGVFVVASVFRVAHNRVADHIEMATNLVGAAC